MSSHPTDITPALVEQLAQALLQRGWSLVTAESCTGGLISAACTELAGSSQWFERGFVTYTNDAKHESLGVDAALIARVGAVSEPVAQAMALGALRHAKAQVSLAVTGVAGPTGGSASRPVGTVCFAWALPSDSGPTLGADTAWVKTERQHFDGDRAQVRHATVQHALRSLLLWLGQKPPAKA